VIDADLVPRMPIAITGRNHKIVMAKWHSSDRPKCNELHVTNYYGFDTHFTSYINMAYKYCIFLINVLVLIFCLTHVTILYA